MELQITLKEATQNSKMDARARGTFVAAQSLEGAGLHSGFICSGIIGHANSEFLLLHSHPRHRLGPAVGIVLAGCLQPNVVPAHGHDPVPSAPGPAPAAARTRGLRGIDQQDGPAVAKVDGVGVGLGLQVQHAERRNLRGGKGLRGHAAPAASARNERGGDRARLGVVPAAAKGGDAD